MPNSPNTTNLFHDDRSYLLVAFIAAPRSGAIAPMVLISPRASAACFRGRS
jgi:hypothetical protein